MNLLPTSLVGAFAPNYELARRYNSREVSDLEDLSVRVIHALQGTWTAFEIIRPKLTLFQDTGYTDYSDQFNQIRAHVGWIIDPRLQSDIEYGKDLQKLWKYLAVCVLGLTVIAVACASAPSLMGRAWR